MSNTITQRGKRGPVELDLDAGELRIAQARTPEGEQLDVVVPFIEITDIKLRHGSMLKASECLLHTVTGSRYEWATYEPVDAFATLTVLISRLWRDAISANVTKDILSEQAAVLREFFDDRD